MTRDFFPDPVLRNRWLNRAIRLLHAREPDRLWKRYGRPSSSPLAKLGSDYGGWLVPVEEVRADWIVYSFGIGQDTTFDEALVARFGTTVHLFDPTPAAIEHVGRRHAAVPALRTSLPFTPVGIWDADCDVRMFEPKTRGWVGSYSALNLQGTQSFIDVPCRTLDTLMRERGHARIDLLKMDDEGAEYRVLARLLEVGTKVSWLCVEFDQPVPTASTRRMLDRLAAAGYALRGVDRWNFIFQHD